MIDNNPGQPAPDAVPGQTVTPMSGNDHSAPIRIRRTPDTDALRGWYCTSKQVALIRQLAGKPVLDVVNQLRADQGKPPIDNLLTMDRADASEIIRCLSAGTTIKHS